MSRQTIFKLISLILILGLFLAACAPAATPAPEVVQTEAAEPAATEPPAAEPPPTEAPAMTEAPAATEATAATEPPAAEGPTGTLRVAISTQPNTLDGPLAAEQQTRNTSRGIFESLIWKNDDGELVPALAESWEVSPDGLEYTFHLRQGVTFHNGEPFTADAVVFSWERYKDETLEWSERWRLADNVEKVDDYTVKMTTTEPRPLLLPTIATFWSIAPPKYFEEVGDVEFGRKPVGTGPFMFVEWVEGDHVTLKAYPDYWQEGVPNVEEVIFRPIPESATRVAAIQKGEVDIVGRLSAEEAQSLEGVEGVQVITYPVSRVYYIAFNNITTGVGLPTEDPLVRQAMNYAVDVDAIIEALFDGNGKRVPGFVATGELGYGIVDPFPYDPDKAKELLAQAGYADGFEMGFACPAGAYTNFEEVCEAVQGYLAEVGITADLEIMESAQYWDLEGNQQLPPLFGDSWSEVLGEAYNRMAGALLGEGYSSWKDDKIIDMLGQIASTVDIDARKKLYEDLQVYMQENPPFIFLYEPVAFEAIRTNVVDYKPRSAEEYYLNDTYIK